MCSGGRYDGLVEKLGGRADAGHRVGNGDRTVRRPCIAASGGETGAAKNVSTCTSSRSATATLEHAFADSGANSGAEIDGYPGRNEPRRRQLQIADEAGGQE